ncbi:MAG: 1,4-alpha-glucan branching protein GlgB [Bacteroidota bacterium]
MSKQTIAHTLFTDFDISLFKEGRHFRVYEKMGSHVVEVDGVAGTYFAVWAPNARAVSIIGNFNRWSKNAHPLIARRDGSGIWEGFVPGVEHGELYQYYIQTHFGQAFAKADPYARFAEVPPARASITWELDYEWQDGAWMEERKATKNQEKPYAVYEVHLGSWKKVGEKSESLSYRQMADELVEYVVEMGFTHIEMMPVMEHPYYPSWGYQITSYFAPTSRYGKPEDFAYLVDSCHQAGIGVILDWVPSHFPNDGFALAKFDGTHLYEHADPRKGFHPDWKSAIFNYSRNEVRNFLVSNALFWLEKYHIDGLRVDAVASMLYLDYSRNDGEWIPNKYGGRENLEAIDFLKTFNEAVHQEYPDVVTIAEESTAWPGVSQPTFSGGLGFDQKWMMGWMHDTLGYFKRETIYRRFHHSEMTFSIVYAFSERFMLPLSHDEVVHGKRSLLEKMPGDEWQRFANLRLLYGYMYTHPGTKLLFMGGEFGQTTEWSHASGLRWEQLEKPLHKGAQRLVSDLNKLYTAYPALYEKQFSYEGFQWIELNDNRNNVLSYIRKGEAGTLMVICNFMPTPHQDFQVGCPALGTWTEVLNSDAKIYGGSDFPTLDSVEASAEFWNNRPYSVRLNLPPLGILILHWEAPAEVVEQTAAPTIEEQHSGAVEEE